VRLEGKTAIVTGGANGIGRATALLFAGEGAGVVIADRDEASGADAAARIVASGGRACSVITDVSRDEDVATLVERAVAEFGGLDILVNSAGVDIAGSVVDTEPERWQRVLDVNLASVYRTCRRAIPRMVGRGGGAIVNVASLQGLYGYPNYAAYAASKAGMIGLTRQMAVEYADDGIRVNAVSPGGIVTNLGTNSARLEPAYHSAPASAPATEPTRPGAPAGRSLRAAGQPLDVAWAILFLASDEAVHISGQNLVVDGVCSSSVE